MSEKIKTESMKDFEGELDAASPWNIVKKYMDEKTTLTVKIEGVVNGGAIAMVEGLRGFIPASRLSLSYTKDLETFLLQEIEVRVIEVNEEDNRLILSAREILRAKQREAQKEKMNSIKVGAVLKGTVENIQDYGAFVNLGDGLSGLVHISQMSTKHVKSPSDVVTSGDVVDVKVIGIKNGKISLSMKALMDGGEEDTNFHVEIPEAEDCNTNLASLLKGLDLK